MRDKLILGVIAISVVILSSFFVMAVVFNQESEKAIKNNSQNQNSLRLIDSEENNDNIEETYESKEDSLEDLNEKEDAPITGNSLEKASNTALEYIGEGKVTDSEIGDEEGYYEIEVTLDNGNQVDVHLDKDFKILSKEYESEDEED